MSDYPVSESAKCGTAIEYIQPTMREQLTKQRDTHLRKAEEISFALDLLDKNPAYEKVHDAMVKVGRLG